MIDCEQMWTIFPKTTQWTWSRLILTKAVSETRDVVTYEGLGLVLLQHTNLISLHWGFLKWGTQAIIQVIGHVSTRGNQKKVKKDTPISRNIHRSWRKHNRGPYIFLDSERTDAACATSAARNVINHHRDLQSAPSLVAGNGTLAGSGPDSPKISQNGGFLKWGQP